MTEREILFRGKRIDNGEWVEGYRCNCIRDMNGEKTYPAIQQTNDNSLYFREILPETVGQYTGLTDKNGRKIFEGDIVDYISSDVIGNPKTGTINVKDMTDYETMVYLNYTNDLEVIGNIHDNPDLL